MEFIKRIKLKYKVFKVVLNFIDRIHETHLVNHPRFDQIVRFKVREEEEEEEEQLENEEQEEQQNEMAETITLNEASSEPLYGDPSTDQDETFEIYLDGGQVEFDPHINLPFYYYYIVKHRLMKRLSGLEYKQSRKAANDLFNFKDKFDEQSEY